MDLNFTDEQISRLESCTECPRICGANRFEREGYCGSPPVPKLASAGLHDGEEPPISGFRGSGTIFFTGCNLSCCYCQNYPISQLHHGREIDLDTLVDTILSLQQRGAHNINFVTPSHASIALEVVIPAARNAGLTIPIIYNTSGYDSVEQLHSLDGLIDIYMPDIRYQDSKIAATLSDAPNYPEINRQALIEMHNQVGDLETDSSGIAVRGLLVRHLILPGNRVSTSEALDFIVEKISTNTYVSLMSQYFPAYEAVDIPGLDRKINTGEWRSAVRAFRESGLNGWIQGVK